MKQVNWVSPPPFFRQTLHGPMSRDGLLQNSKNILEFKESAVQTWDAVHTWLVQLHGNFNKSFEIWAGAQLEPVIGGSATRFKFFKIDLWFLF